MLPGDDPAGRGDNKIPLLNRQTACSRLSLLSCANVLCHTYGIEQVHDGQRGVTISNAMHIQRQDRSDRQAVILFLHVYKNTRLMICCGCLLWLLFLRLSERERERVQSLDEKYRTLLSAALVLFKGTSRHLLNNGCNKYWASAAVAVCLRQSVNSSGVEAS